MGIPSYEVTGFSETCYPSRKKTAPTYPGGISTVLPAAQR